MPLERLDDRPDRGEVGGVRVGLLTPPQDGDQVRFLQRQGPAHQGDDQPRGLPAPPFHRSPTGEDVWVVPFDRVLRLGADAVGLPVPVPHLLDGREQVSPRLLGLAVEHFLAAREGLRGNVLIRVDLAERPECLLDPRRDSGMLLGQGVIRRDHERIGLRVHVHEWSPSSGPESMSPSTLARRPHFAACLSFRWASNQSAIVGRSCGCSSGQPCALPSLTTSRASTPFSLSLSTMISRLLDRHQEILVAVDDQGGRIVGRHVRDRADLPADLHDLADVRHRHECLLRWRRNRGSRTAP